VSKLGKALDALLAEHVRIGSPVREFVIAGRSFDEVRGWLIALGIEPAEDLVEFYAFQDGIASSVWRREYGGRGDLYLFPWYSSPDLHEVEQRYRIHREVSVAAYGTEPRQLAEIPEVGYWAASWCPLFIGCRSFAADSRGGRSSTVWAQASQPGCGPRAPLYPSILDMITDITDRFRQGVYTWLADAADFGSDGDLEMRFDRQVEERSLKAPIDPHGVY
jgi:hypothetical protein